MRQVHPVRSGTSSVKSGTDRVVVSDYPTVSGKFAAEHDMAVGDLGAAHGFAAEHNAALAAVGEAGG